MRGLVLRIVVVGLRREIGGGGQVRGDDGRDGGAGVRVTHLVLGSRWGRCVRENASERRAGAAGGREGS